MIIFDLLLLLFVSGMLAVKSLYLGSITIVAGFLIGFQNQRTIRLLGVNPEPIRTARKVKAAILALLIGACCLPFLLEHPLNAIEGFDKSWSEETILPVVVVIGLLASAMMAALVVEKRKR